VKLAKTVTLVIESPSSTSTKSTCDAERDSQAGRNSNAGGGIANFHIDDGYVEPRRGRGKAEVTYVGSEGTRGSSKEGSRYI